MRPGNAAYDASFPLTALRTSIRFAKPAGQIADLFR